VARSRHRVALATIALSFAVPAGASAQDLIDVKSAAHVRDRYLADLDTVHAKVVALATAIPEDKYAWRPAQGVRSISEALMHVASEWYLYAPMSIGGKPPADFGVPREALPRLEKIATKREVLAELEKSWTHCKAQLMAADPAKLTGKVVPWNVPLVDAAFVMSGDLHEHLGQLIAYARSVGVKPPWSK
jgi:uncharacterized damage-inducible protein DinB